MNDAAEQLPDDLASALVALAEERARRIAPISPTALEAVKWIDALFDIERAINGVAAEQRLEHCCKNSLPLAEELHDWLQNERAKLSVSTSSPAAEPSEKQASPRARTNGIDADRTDAVYAGCLRR